MTDPHPDSSAVTPRADGSLSQTNRVTYEAAGVSIDAGDKAVELM
jgi:hypothetical protein